MKDRRIFIAIDISDAARLASVRHIDYLRRQFVNVRVGWEKPEKLHITMKFLGDTNENVLAEVISGLGGIGSMAKPFSLRLSHTGVFPSPRKPRILWLGVDDSGEDSLRIATEAEELCEGLGFKRESRAFTPHITIARAREPERSRDVAAAHLSSQIEPVEFDVTSLVVYESELHPTGSVYSKLAEIKLSTV